MQIANTCPSSTATPFASTALVTTRLPSLWVLVISWLVVLPSATVIVSSPVTVQSQLSSGNSSRYSATA